MRSPKHFRACAWLLAATGVWGLSFPFIKATWLAQQEIMPGMSSVFFAAMLAVVRFGVAGLIVGFISLRTLRSTTKLEWEQGIGLGIFGGLGILFQMDGLAYTEASTSAFLTQFYCLVIPFWVAFHQRAFPKFTVVTSSVMVLSGVAILSRFDWRDFKMGRGEAETLIAAVFFAGQILWLERPRYAGNRVGNFTTIMFVVITVLMLPVGAFTLPSGPGWIAAYLSPKVLLLIAVITFGCTLISYTVMNKWQPHVTATEAGLIYCLEPLYASVFALFLPGWISEFVGIDYPNEHVTIYLLAGGGLITAANVLIQLEAVFTRRRLAAAGRSPHVP